MHLRGSGEEADTLFVLYAANIYKHGQSVHIYASDIDVLVLGLAAIPTLGDRTVFLA